MHAPSKHFRASGVESVYLFKVGSMHHMNTLYYGDNLDILRRHIAPQSVDLVYLDPPFKSMQDYNVLFQEQDGSRAAAQLHAFEDTWQWDQASSRAYREAVEKGESVSSVLQAFWTFLGPSDILAYLSMMAPRLMELRKAMKATSSIYLHCDPTASHYLKMLMDAVFGPLNFRNEIIWRRTGSHNSTRRFGPIHDTILFYTKTDDYYYRTVYRPYLKGHVDGYFRKRDERGRYWTNALTGSGTRKGASGMPWKGYDPTGAGRHWAIPGRIAEALNLSSDLSVQERLDAVDAAGFIDHPAAESRAMPTYRQYLKDSSGMPLQDIWAYQPHTRGVLHGTDEGIDEDVRWLIAQGDPERLGYQTQKPVGILKRIIESSCPENGLVLDPFCGCGTTVAAAQHLGRSWTGIDITYAAIRLIKKRLQDVFGGVPYDVVGEPTSVPDAEQLAENDPYQFQWWALGRVDDDARPTDGKKGADKGIDGRLYFHDDEKGPTKQIVFSVKGGHRTRSHVHELRGVLDREAAAGAVIGVLILRHKPTRPMREEAASAGFYDSPSGTRHPRIQLITVEQLLQGAKVDYPPTRAAATFKKAPKAKSREAQPDLDL